MLNNVVSVSGIQQSDSIMHTHVSILFYILFPFRLLQNIEQSPLCYTTGRYWLSVLNIAVRNVNLTPSSSLSSREKEREERGEREREKVRAC